jgi:hypothetical protein
VASIVSMLVETEELSDVNDRYKIQEIQIKHELAEEWIDNSWEPEPIDASPGEYLFWPRVAKIMIEHRRIFATQNFERKRPTIS